MQAKDVGLLTPQQFREENTEGGKADTGLSQKSNWQWFFCLFYLKKHTHTHTISFWNRSVLALNIPTDSKEKLFPQSYKTK